MCACNNAHQGVVEQSCSDPYKTKGGLLPGVHVHMLLYVEWLRIRPPDRSYVSYAYELLLSCPVSSGRGTKLVTHSARSPGGRCRN
jgi:hypothetical protein